jgi:hypothetical protein
MLKSGKWQYVEFSIYSKKTLDKTSVFLQEKGPFPAWSKGPFLR